MHAKFEVSSFNRSGDMEGVPKIQKKVTWPVYDPIWPNFAFFSLAPLVVNLHVKFEVSSFNRFLAEIWTESQNSKSRSRDPFSNPFA